MTILRSLRSGDLKEVAIIRSPKRGDFSES